MSDAAPVISSPVTSAAPAVAPLPPKSMAVAYVLLICVGVLGIHRFYLGKIGTGILFLLTGGLLGIGVIVDLFLTVKSVRAINAQRALGFKN